MILSGQYENVNFLNLVKHILHLLSMLGVKMASVTKSVFYLMHSHMYHKLQLDYKLIKMFSWSRTLIKAKGQILKGNAKGWFTRLKLMVDLLKGANARYLIANVDGWLAGWIAAKTKMQRLKCIGWIAKDKM